MDRILFIVPPYASHNSYINPEFNERVVVKKNDTFGSLVTDMPIGVLSLSAYIKGYSNSQTRLIDFNIVLNKLDEFNYTSFSELYREILSSKELREFSPSMIGISALFTTSYYNMLDIAREARKLFPYSLIFAGGGVPTNMYEEIFRDSNDFDALCFGEGEKPLLELINTEDKMALLKKNSSWITPEKIKAKQSYQHDFIEDLDIIPHYDYDILNIYDYCLSPTVKTYATVDGSQAITFHIATSRGCIHKCSFCASHTVHGRKMRYHSVAWVRKEIERLKEKYNAVSIGVQDDHFMADRNRAFQIIDIIKEFNISVFFQSGLALYALDLPMLEAMKSAGVKQLVLAVESGCNRILRKIMHKPINLTIVRRVVDDCRKLGIATDANIVVGLPGETKQDIEDSRAFLKTLDANWFRIYIATPLVGSEMLEICLEKGYLQGDYIGCDFKRAVIETEDFTAEYIKEKAYELNLELNFVCNSDFRLGHYEAALKGFINTIKVKNDHALAHYFAAKSYRELHCNDKYLEHKSKYNQIIAASELWRGYAQQFELAPLE